MLTLLSEIRFLSMNCIQFFQIHELVTVSPNGDVSEKAEAGGRELISLGSWEASLKGQTGGLSFLFTVSKVVSHTESITEYHTSTSTLFPPCRLTTIYFADFSGGYRHFD